MVIKIKRKMKENKQFMNKKSQIFIFIILALLLVVIFLILFLLFRPVRPQLIDENNPQAFVESCVSEATEDAIKILSVHGGDIEPKGFVLHQGKDITYLCYNINYYISCVYQRPQLIEHIEKEITNYIFPIVAKCFQALEENLERRYEIKNPSDLSIETRLWSKNIAIEIDKVFEMKRGKIERKFDFFKVNLISPIYNLADISMEIANQEAQYCGFDHLGHMILYPSYNIEKFETGDGTMIYTVTEIATDQSFVFAIRSCVLPPGYSGN